MITFFKFPYQSTLFPLIIHTWINHFRLSLEHRNNLLKQLGQMAEKSKISIRHHRQHARNKLKTFAKSMEQRQIRRLEQMVSFILVILALFNLWKIDNKANENSKIVDDMMKLKAKNIKPKWRIYHFKGKFVNFFWVTDDWFGTSSYDNVHDFK